MEIDVFSITTSATSLDTAFNIMKSGNRSAIVVQDAGVFWFADAADVVIARAEGTATTLQGIPNRVALDLVPIARVSSGLLDFRSMPVQKALELYLDSSNRRFAILALTSSRAVVASRSELDMGPKQASPRDCYCKTDGKAVSHGVQYGDCPHNPSHLGTVRCV